MVKANKSLYNEFIEKFHKHLETEKKIPKKEIEKIHIEVLEFLDKTYPFLKENEKNGEYIKHIRHYKAKVNSYLSKSSYSNSFEVVFFIKEKVTDFGKRKKITEAKEMFKMDKKRAVELNLTNENGEVLDQNGFNKGKPINMNNILSRKMIGITSIDGKSYIFEYNLKQDHINEDIPLNTFIKIKGSKQTEENYKRNLELGKIISNSTNDFSWELVEEERPEINEEFVKKHLSNKFIKDINEYANDKDKGFGSWGILKCNIDGFNYNKEKDLYFLNIEPKNVVEDTNFDMFDFNGDNTYNGISSVDLKCKENSEDCLVFLDTYISDKDDIKSVRVNVYGAVIPDDYKEVNLFDEETEKDIEEVKKQVEEDKNKKESSSEPKVEPKVIEAEETSW